MVFIVGNIENAARCSRRARRADICLHHIGNIREIARLPAIAVYGRLLVVQHAMDKFGDYHRILIIQALTRAKNIEIAQAHGRQLVMFAKNTAIVFPC